MSSSVVFRPISNPSFSPSAGRGSPSSYSLHRPLNPARFFALRFRLLPFPQQHHLHRFNIRHFPLCPAFPRDGSKPSDVEVEGEENGLKQGSKEAEEAWQHALDAFKEQAFKLQSVSQEAYDLYSRQALIILKETSEKLKIQSERARQELSAIATEFGEESKEYLLNAAETSPEPLKDIVETLASSTNELNEVSKVRDFHLGIPYGALLCVGGFLSFMFAGSISAIRFGIILGGTLLALSISSLRLWRNGESSSLAIKGQAAISGVLFLRELRLVLERPFIGNYVTAFISGSVMGFYIYRILTDRIQVKESNLGKSTEN